MTRLLHPALLALLIASASASPPDAAPGGPGLAEHVLTAEEIHRLADGLHARGLHDLAIAEYSRLLRDHPDYPQADAVIFRLAESYRRTGQPGPAELLYARLPREFPNSAFTPVAVFRRAELQESLGNAERAEALYAEVVARGEPKDLVAAAAYRRGRLQRARGDVAAAVESWRSAWGIAPDTLAGRWAALEASEAILGRASSPSEWDEALGLLRKVADQDDPESAPEALFRLQRYAHDQGDHRAALEWHAELMRRYPGAARAAESRQWAAWSRLALNQPQEALALARQALESSAPSADADAWLWIRALAERAAGDREAAARSLQKLIENYPQSSRRVAAVLEAADLAIERGAFDEAEQWLVLAKAEAEVAEEAEWLEARRLEAMGRSSDALDLYRRIADRTPAGPRAPDALLRWAGLLEQQGAWAGAAELYERCAERHPAHPSGPRAQAAAAAARARAGQWDRARDHWLDMVRGDVAEPWREEAHFNLGIAEVQLRRFDEAAHTLREFLAAYPESRRRWEARYWLSVALERAGREAEALDVLAAAEKEAWPPEWLGRYALRHADLLRRQGRAEDAARLLLPLLASDVAVPWSPEALDWLAAFAHERHEPAWTLRAAEQLLQQGEGRWQALGWYWLGRAREAAQKTAEAMDAYARALAAGDGLRGRERAEALHQLARLLLEQRRLPEARERFAELARVTAAEDALLPWRAHALMRLGEIAELEERWDEAARYYLGTALLFDDPLLAPEGLRRAAACYRRIGAEEKADQLLRERAVRYPEAAPVE